MTEYPHTRVAPGFFCGRTLDDLGAALRANTLSAVELTRVALAEIERLDGEINAFTTVDAQGALHAARQAEAELTSGVDRGPLHGIPVGIKDIIDVAGLPTTMGSAHFADHVSTSDAECVRLLREAGAVLIGKTTTHEIAFGPTGDRTHTGAVRNPHDPQRMSGGSSSGSAAAVAAGMVPLALGTDTGGSVRIPAALCGIAGFKPGFDAISTRGVFPLASSLDHVGVLAGNAVDCRTSYRVLAGLRPMPSRAHGARARIGWIPPDLLHATDSAVLRLAREAIEGHEVCEIRPRETESMARSFTAIQFSEAYAVHADRIAEHPELFTDDVRELLLRCGKIAGWQYVRGLQERQKWRAGLAELFDEVDLLALPTTCVPAPMLDQRAVSIDGNSMPVREALIGFTRPFNLAGIPAISVPAGEVDGLPVGLQLVAQPGGEDLLFVVAGRLARWREPVGAATKKG